MNKDTILEVVKNLLNKTTGKGCTEAEALAASMKAAQLLQQHQLSMFDVAESTLGEETAHVTVVSDYTDPPIWATTLMGEICKGFNCKSIRTKTIQGRKMKTVFNVIGMESDAKIAMYFYVTLSDKLWWTATSNVASLGYSGSQSRDYKTSFIMGAAIVIGDRLKAEKDSQKAVNPTFGAMIVVKDKKVSDAYKEAFPNVVTRHRSTNASLGYGDGMREGGKINLHRGGLGHGGGYLEKK